MDAELAQIELLVRGRQFAAAEVVCARVLNRTPQEAHAWYLLAAVRGARGDLAGAEDALRKAIERNGACAEYWDSLSVTLVAAGRGGEAELCSLRAVDLEPSSAPYLSNLGNARYAQGRWTEASEEYRRALALDEGLASVWANLGASEQAQHRYAEAEWALRQAVERQPDNLMASLNLALSLLQLSKHAEAERWLRHTLNFHPQSVQARLLLGKLLEQHHPHESAECYQAAIQLEPHRLAAHQMLGALLHRQGRYDAAIEAYRRALQFEPNSAEAHLNLGLAHFERGEFDAAVESHERAVAINPRYADAYFNLGIPLRELARTEAAIGAFRAALAIDPGHAAAHSALAYTLYFCEGFDNEEIYEEHARWNARHAQPLSNTHQPHANNRNAQRRLRIGYVSPDFRQHVLACCMLPAFAARDRAQVEIVCYSDVARPDSITAQLQGLADLWRNIHGKTDEQAAELIRQDQIDILVDATMHMGRGRPKLFAMKPAPVQACWLAYPGTTGLSEMDYRLTDAYLDPDDVSDAASSEKFIRLPSFWCYRPLVGDVRVGEAAVTRNGHVTFGCLNSFAKLNANTLARWALVMREAATSSLMLLAPKGSARGWVLDTMQGAGVEATRIEFVGRQPLRQYLETYHRIDICLDTLPYNGHMTSLDALWMGVPVVTLVGETVVGRAGLSQLSTVGLKELMANGDDDFVHIASELAADIPRLVQLRSTLRQRLESSPIMDAQAFARHLELGYRHMWQTWCQKWQ